MLRNKFRVSLFFILLSILFFVISCTEDGDDLGPQNEEFVGTYMARDITLVADFILMDSVRFSVIRNSTYSMDFYRLIADRDSVAFCDHSGRLLDFGTAKVTFDPTVIPNGLCDNVSLPHETFVADFISFGDTIKITRRVSNPNGSPAYDSIFELKLLK